MATCTSCGEHIPSDEGHFEDEDGMLLCFDCKFDDDEEIDEEEEDEDGL